MTASVPFSGDILPMSSFFLGALLSFPRRSFFGWSASSSPACRFSNDFLSSSPPPLDFFFSFASNNFFEKLSFGSLDNPPRQYLFSPGHAAAPPTPDLPLSDFFFFAAVDERQTVKVSLLHWENQTLPPVVFPLFFHDRPPYAYFSFFSAIPFLVTAQSKFPCHSPLSTWTKPLEQPALPLATPFFSGLNSGPPG